MMQKENHTARLISLHQGTSKSALEFLYKNLEEIEKDLACILNYSELEDPMGNRKVKHLFPKSNHKK